MGFMLVVSLGGRVHAWRSSCVGGLDGKGKLSWDLCLQEGGGGTI